MALSDQLLSQVRNNPLGTPVKLLRATLVQRCNLCNSHFPNDPLRIRLQTERIGHFDFLGASSRLVFSCHQDRLAVLLRNHRVLSLSFVANSLLLSTAGVAAARASRSKLSASSKTAFLALGSVNCPATSCAFSARSSHSKAHVGPPSRSRSLLRLFTRACKFLRPVTPKGTY